MKISDITCGRTRNGSISMTDLQWRFAKKMFGSNFSAEVRYFVTKAIENLPIKEFNRISQEIQKEIEKENENN